MNADWPIPINLAAKPPMGVALPPRGAGAALAPALSSWFLNMVMGLSVGSGGRVRDRR